MPPRSGSVIRETFLRFFESKGHRRVHSSSLVPANDPTLLFANAGMVQFKDVFLGAERRDYARATSSQKCVRAGGKHNDLENVGFTRRHHTFFEMLGNFSFGDYYKRDAIAFAWEFLTSPEWFGMPKDRLHVTIFAGEDGVPRDDEAEKYWIEAGVPKERIHEFGLKDNFWQMGETGPCGPNSEVIYERLEITDYDKSLPFGEDDARYVEIWNLVFMQFDRSAVVDAAGKTTGYKLTPLPKPSIDTGMGLERVVAVLQGKLSNFDTDLFTPLIARAAELTSTSYKDETSPTDASLRIIADHARAATFLISDGVLPANEGRGYVLRKILRRAIRHGRLLGKEEPFMFQMVDAVRDQMEKPYPELAESAGRVSRVVQAEEERFSRTLALGAKQLDAAIAGARLATEGGIPRLEGALAFHLYETFGLPLDFMTDAARDQGISFDLSGFERARAEEQARARASWKGGAKSTANPLFRELPKSVFEGYRQLTSHDCEVLAIVKDGAGVSVANPGESVEVVLDHTSFYADSGGQIGDVGWLYSDDHNTLAGDVLGCVQPVQGVRAHKVYVRQPIAVGSHVDTVVDSEYRSATQRNHTGTHLLHAGLREVLGKHVKQAGSLVDPTRLRFDFSHFAPVADEELKDIEEIINREVLANTKVETLVDVPIDVAVNDYHAMALFGEKYGERVRVVRIGDFSTELCGGTHTAATGEIGLIKLLGENSVSSGVRRVEALTGFGALREFRRDQEVADLAGQIAGAPGLSPAESLRQKLSAHEEELRKLRRELDQSRMKSAASSVSTAAQEATDVGGIKVIAQRVDAPERGQARPMVEKLRKKLGSGVVILGSSQQDGKVALIVGVTKDLTSRLPAGKVIAPIALQVGGSGGGRPDMAEAGGKDAAALNSALESAPEVVRRLLG
jgi:alanyl-tRNA synthetase